MRVTRLLLVGLVCAAVGACGADEKVAPLSNGNDGGAGASGSGGAAGASGAAGSDASTGPEPASFKAGGSIYEVWVTDAKQGDALSLMDASSKEVATGTADRLGSFIFRDVTPGPGYTVQHVAGEHVYATPAIKVLSPDDVPDPSLYNQVLKPGLNYVKMRDGIELAMAVRLPEGKTLADGPFPTVIEYSGYQTAAPHDLVAAVLSALSSGKGLDVGNDPLLPDTSTAVGSLIMPMVGFAAVSVQMRGSGCSGGDFQLFDYPTVYDGYDAIETVAHQSWVKGNKVGMVGISFSGISQLSVAGTRPPHLAAIAPMSVTDDIYTGTGFPGGILNNGFAKSWLDERQANAQPAPEKGAQPYAVELVNEGDQHCIDNQKLRVQTQDINQLIEDHPFRDPALIDHRSGAWWADKINVPVFLCGQFQDEQTGGHFPEMLGSLAQDPDVWITMQNGPHVDALGPATFTRWAEFLDLFVGDEIPSLPGIVSTFGPQLMGAIAAGTPSEAFPAVRFSNLTDVSAARTAFRKDPRVRVLFDNGGGDVGPGALQPTWELGFDSWPVKQAVATTYYLDAGGALVTTAPASAEVSYTGNPALRPRTNMASTGNTNAWAPLPNYDWEPVADGAGLGFVTAPLAQDALIAGASSLDLQVKSSAKDTDIQVTISDVRPDGQEMYVQSGWVRASHRTVDAAKSTPTDPVLDHLASDASDLPAGTFTLVRVPIYPVAYAFRAGHRIRITIQAPGGERPAWAFDTLEDGTITDTIQLGTSKLVLPIVPGATAGAPMPACPSNRGMPCRAYKAATNGG